MNALSTALAYAAMAAGLLAGTAAASDGLGHAITIGPDAIDPVTVRVALHERVVFVNRSGRGIHVDFHGPRGEHHVVHVPSTVWAEFHWPGRHPYVVHFSAGQPPELHGLVEVDHGPPLIPTLECGGFTVAETCIER